MAISEIRIALADYQENPGEAAARVRLTRALREASALIARLPRKDTQSAYVAEVRQLVREVSASGAHDQRAEPEDLARADSLARKGWQGTLAAMLLAPAWQWVGAPLLLAVPDWLQGDYVSWLFAAPQGFCAVGDAEAYAAHTLARLEELARWVNRCPDAVAETEVLTAFAQSSTTPLYASVGSLRRHAELRGRLLARVFKQPEDGFEVAPQTRTGRRIRIGFVCRAFGPTAETYTTLPTFEQLDPDRFEVALFVIRSGSKPFEDYGRAHAQEFQLLPGDTDGQLAMLRTADLDVVVFSANLATGCDELTILALHRVAPLQIASHLSCLTTGLAEIDLYVSGELLELPQSPDGYIERLGLLPGSAYAFNFEIDRQEPSSSLSRAALGIPESAVVYSTAADHTRITPEMRHAWARLLTAVPDSRLLVHPFGLSGSTVSAVKRFSAEFDQVLAQYNVAGDRLIVSTGAFSSRADLKELLRLGDLYLDSYPCSDVDALVSALSCGLPVVTREGSTARARAGAAVLRTLKLDELVVGSEPEYHDLAVRLAGDAAPRAALRAQIEERLARSPVVFDALAASDAFGALVETAYDAVLATGLKAFRADRTPLRAVTTSDLAPAELALASGDASEAARCAQAVLARDPANPRARHVLGVAFLKFGRAERATQYLLETVQQRENDASAWCELAKAFQASGRTREAVQAVRVCLGIDQRDLEALLLLGEIAGQDGEVSDLAEVAELARSIAPQDSRVRALIARVGEARSGSSAPIQQQVRVELAQPAPVAIDPVEILSNLSLDSLIPAGVVASLDRAQRGNLATSAARVAPHLSPAPSHGSHPNPRALLFFLSAQDSYRQPLFSDQEVFCGPDTETRHVAGRVSALKIPPGAFDVRDVVRALPVSQQPEIVIVKADATGRNLPRNLGELKCPKVLLVGDTHHMRRPVQGLLRYALEEPFDFVVFDHTRHHAHLFAEAGVKNVHWLPAVDYGFVPRKLVRKPSRPLTFVGQAGRHHPYRCWVLEQVKAAGLPLEVLRGALADTADLYADSQVTLNVSLNGDLNLRVFEALAAGGFLLTDELPVHSGLPLLFEAGKHLATWRTPEELIEKIRYYLGHPAEAQRIRAAGQAELLRAHHPEVKLREFYELVFSGKANPVYDLGRDARCGRAIAKAAVSPLAVDDPLIAAYECLQELHRVSRQVTVYCAAPTDMGKFADLPRLSFAPLAELGALEAEVDSTAPMSEGVLWAENVPAPELANHLLTFVGHVIAPNASAAVVETLVLCGYSPSETGSDVYRLARPLQALQRAWEAGQRDHVRGRLAPVLPTLQDSNDCLTVAHLADQLEDRALKRAAIERAIGLDRSNQAALITSAADSLDDSDAASALVMLEEAARIAPLTPEVEQLRAGLYTQLGQQVALEPYYRMIGRTPVQSAEHPRRILIVTNLFPPQELGGYGRKMWEFAHGLVARGHQVSVLAGDLPEIAKPPTPDEVEMDRSVSRDLQLLGTWTKGIPSRVEDPKEVDARRKHNRRLVTEAMRVSKAEFVFAGNLDFLGADIIHVALEAGLPVLQALGNTAPGYAPAEQPASPRYWIGSCSHWNAGIVKKNGYTMRTEVVYPGGRVDRFFRFFMPERGRLRICFAGLVMPFKGVHILVEALGRLQQAGVDFTAELAGDTTDPQFLARLRAFAERMGMADRITYSGFLDRVELSALFARSNVLVFPSIVAEGFGISQVEALAAGLVVVSSGTGGAREIIRDGVDGLLYPAEDVTALAEKLHALATDPELFARLQAASQQRATAFAVERSVCKIEQCMEELIGKC